MRMDSSDEEYEENKLPRKGPSPNKIDEEKKKHVKVLNNLEKKGMITSEEATEYGKLAEIASQEKEYLKDVRRRRLSGEQVSKTGFELDCAVFEAKKFQVKSRLSDLNNLANTEAKAITYITPESSPDATILDEKLFTDDES